MSRIKDLEDAVDAHRELIRGLQEELHNERERSKSLKSELAERRIIGHELYYGLANLYRGPISVKDLSDRQWLILQYLGLKYVPPQSDQIGSLEPIEEGK